MTTNFTIASVFQNPAEDTRLSTGERRIKTRPFLFITPEGQVIQFEYAVFLVPPQELKLSSYRAGDTYNIKASMLAPCMIAYKLPDQDEVVVE